MTTAGHTASEGDLLHRYAIVRESIEKAAARAGKPADQILLVAVTKYAEPEQILQLVQAGHRDFGENRVQQLLQRATMLDEHVSRMRAMGAVLGGDPSARSHEPIRWHMIGRLQRNKTRQVADACRLIHSVDSLRVAEELQEIGLKRDKPVEILLQVNCSGEAGKAGCPSPAVLHVVEQIHSMIHLKLRGMMTIAPDGEHAEDSRPVFQRCRELFEEVQTEGMVDPSFNILSMGMSGDYEVAIEEGANLVRVGSSIFGSTTTDDAEPTPAPEAD
ncbi:MAG: YggS family pyridoxal phosphate-dependent enzyme [Phycisphaerales bacterium]|nr:YggS family pyridoxal phosphate-dependent enzyme [Phycisphaerales bacterium]